MYLIILGWLYVVGMVALTTAAHPQGSILQAILVFVFVGMLPMGLALYIFGHGARRRRDTPEGVVQATAATSAVPGQASGEGPGPGKRSARQPDGSGHASGT